jgi:hypothetical protein
MGYGTSRKCGAKNTRDQVLPTAKCRFTRKKIEPAPQFKSDQILKRRLGYASKQHPGTVQGEFVSS